MFMRAGSTESGPAPGAGGSDREGRDGGVGSGGRKGVTSTASTGWP
jgi:hypothetical protein